MHAAYNVWKFDGNRPRTFRVNRLRKWKKNANSALHTAKNVIVDRILQEMYTSRFDESSHVEGWYTSVQRVKI